MTLVVTEVLAHGATTVGRNVLQGGRLRSSRGNHDGVVHGAKFSELVDNLSYGRALLADSDIDANDVAAFLVDDCVEGDCGLSRLPVADDQFPLPATNGNHAVNGL